MPDGSAFPDKREIPDKNNYSPNPDRSAPNRDKPDTTIHPFNRDSRIPEPPKTDKKIIQPITPKPVPNYPK